MFWRDVEGGVAAVVVLLITFSLGLLENRVLYLTMGSWISERRDLALVG